MPAGREIEGILLYPTTGSHCDLHYQIHGHKVRVVTLNLNQDWRAIRAALLALAG